jgi:hypothetical protein
MDEDEVPKALTVGLTLAAVAAVVGLAIRLDRRYTRTYGRWLTDISPLTGPRARVVRFKTTYRRRKLDATDIGQLVNELWEEIDLARALRR